MIKIVRYEPGYFYEVDRWFTVRDIPFPAEIENMPDVGLYMALYDDVPAAFGAMTFTNSFIGIMNHMITNPDMSGIKTARALTSLMAYLDKCGKLAGCSVIMASYASESIGKVLRKFGYSEPKVHYISSRRTDLGD